MGKGQRKGGCGLNKQMKNSVIFKPNNGSNLIIYGWLLVKNLKEMKFEIPTMAFKVLLYDEGMLHILRL